MTTLSSQFHSKQHFLLLLPVILVFILADAAEEQPLIPRPGCIDKCGDVDIHFPFGIGPGCFREGFEVLCNHSRVFPAGNKTYTSEWLFYTKGPDIVPTLISPLELVSISVATGEARAYGPIAYNCLSLDQVVTYTTREIDLVATPFAVSSTRNVLIGVGRAADAILYYGSLGASVSCRSYYEQGYGKNGTCTEQGCCERTVPPNIIPYQSPMLSVRPYNSTGANHPPYPIYGCSYSMVVEKSWYNFSTPDIYDDKALLKRFPLGVSVVLDFAIIGKASCPAEGQPPLQTTPASATTAIVPTKALGTYTLGITMAISASA
ncbi:hypothetical protein QYE76_024745 [Lolium multiflorum]|uniref:Wall-associated receptor kinase galacturonan-binding domain-containing protein n=1 Tax=Lolium multiflorum TaxID=4521 RepID=A0AAD8RH92_LOLMU|nr:hypothetical protein QYE76_024745 [Lolium multiflorum]